MQGTSATLNLRPRVFFPVYARKSRHREGGRDRERESHETRTTDRVVTFYDRRKSQRWKHNSSANDKNFASAHRLHHRLVSPPFFSSTLIFFSSSREEFRRRMTNVLRIYFFSFLIKMCAKPIEFRSLGKIFRDISNVHVSSMMIE